MTRSILEGTQLWDSSIMSGWNMKTAGLAITADFVMPANGPPQWWFDAGATNRNIALPAITGNLATMEGRKHTITNVSASAILTVNLAAADGATLVTTVPPGYIAEFNVIKGVWRIDVSSVATGGSAGQASKYTANATVGSQTAAVGDLTGAALVVADYTALGGGNLTTRTAAQMLADQRAAVGDSYTLLIRNPGAGTLTLVGGTGVTIAGTATIATATDRLFNVKFNSTTTATIQNIGGGIAV